VHRRDIDDAAAAGTAQLGEGGPADPEDAGEVDGNGQVPDLVAHVLEPGIGLVDAGAIDDAIDPAKSGQHGCDGGAYVRLAGYVGLMKEQILLARPGLSRQLAAGITV